MTRECDIQYIGLFDSGVGGVTVLHQAQEMLPHEHYLFFADSANVPYGSKTASEILHLVDRAVDQMMKYEMKAVVLACNTATSVAASMLRKKYAIPIIGMEPAVKPAILDGDPRKVLVLATDLTLKESKFHELIESLDIKDKVEALPMQALVDFAEEYDFDSPKLKRYLKSSMSQVNWEEYHSIVLGCTHFLYFKSLLAKYVPRHIHFVDGHEGTIRHLSNSIKRNNFGTPSQMRVMLSGLDVATEVIVPYLNYLDIERTRLISTTI